MHRLRPPAWLPLMLGLLAWVAGAGLLWLNLLRPALGYGPVKLATPLIGVTQPVNATLTLDGVLDGSFQAAFARTIGTEVPIYPAAVRLRNQIEFSAFGGSAVPALMVGPGHQLLEHVYAEEYCSRDMATWRPEAARWAASIRRMQDDVERRGQVFLYVLTPSKVSLYPDVLPAGYHCPASAADRAGTTTLWVDALQAAGVKMVDTVAVVAAARGRYPFRMYPEGGAHWNAVGAALAEQAVMQALNRLDPAGGFAPYTFTWHMTPHPVGLDVDLANLLNLRRPFPGGPVPAVDLHPAPPPVPCPDTRVVIVGGSFSHATLENLAKTTCNPHPVEYEYWRTYRLRWDTQSFDLQYGVDPAERDKTLLAANVVIYEENEQVLPDPRHGRAFLEWLETHPTP